MSSFGKWRYLIKRNIIVFNSHSKLVNRSLCTTSTSCQNGEFKMPEYIPRSKTDILKALDSTVKRDKTGPHYRYHDDPYLTPVSNVSKRFYALSKESGKRAAQYVRDNHPELFVSTADDPVIKLLNPTESFNEDSEVTEHTLQELIDSRRVEDALTVYRLCDSKGIEVSANIKQSLLELLCFYNETDPDLENWQEELYFQRRTRPGYDRQNTWKIDGLAEDLFLSMENPTAESYAAIIRGMAAYNNVNGAWQYYEDAVKKNMPIDLQTYNALIPTVALKHDSHDERWIETTKILKSMAERKITPDIITLNNCLQVLGNCINYRKGKKYSLQLLKEMSLQGIKPSLASYYFLLMIFYKKSAANTDVIYSILDELEKEGDIEPKDPRDSFFFIEAMDVCKNSLKCLDTAHRVQAILETGSNQNYQNCSFFESLYYRMYLELALNSLPADEFMQFYNTFVPHLFSPDYDVMDTILRNIATHGNFEFIPTLWTDIVAMNLMGTKVVTTLLDCLCQYVPEDDPFKIISEKQKRAYESGGLDLGNEFTEVVSLAEQITRIVHYIIEQVNEERSKVEWTGMHCGQILQVLSVCGGVEAAENLLKTAAKSKNVVGEIPLGQLKQLCAVCLQHGYPGSALASVLYLNEYEPEAAREMAVSLASMTELTENQRAKLAETFGGSLTK